MDKNRKQFTSGDEEPQKALGKESPLCSLVSAVHKNAEMLPTSQHRPLDVGSGMQIVEASLPVFRNLYNH